MKIKEYTTIKELTKNVEAMFESKVIDGWQENRYWVSILAGELLTMKNPQTGEIKHFQRGLLRIKSLLPI